MSRNVAIFVVMAAMLVVACDGQEPSAGAAEGWIEGEVPAGNGGLPPGDPAGVEDGGEEGEEGDEEGDELEDGSYATITGELVRDNGTFTGGFGEFWGFEVLDGEQTDVCIVAWPSVVVSEPTDCDACEFAVELEYGEPEIELDEGCAGYGFDPATVPGTRVAVGYAGGEALYVRVDGDWIESGFAEMDGDLFFFEYEAP